jgi:hypothetical protein
MKLCGVRAVSAWCFAFVALAAVPAAGQTITDGRVWYTLTMQGRPAASSRWRWGADVILRSRDGLDALDVLTLRASVGRDLTPRLTLWGGYTNTHTYLASGGSTLEHRPFLQASWAHPSGGGSLSLRTRLEARVTEGNNRAALRLRHQTRYSHPFSPGNPWSWVVTDEIFFHLNTTFRFPSGFDQNRAFAGVSVTLPKTRLEMGYLNQFVQSSIPDRVNHIVSVTTSVTF